MFYTDTGLIRKKMNNAEKEKISFLFGINFDLSEGFFIENPLKQSDILFQIMGLGNKKIQIKVCKHFIFDYTPISLSAYKKKFDIIHKGLRRGDSFLTNLTIKTPIITDLTLRDIFDRSASPFQLYLPNQFVCFSPERFVKIRNSEISTNPMKGTIDANIPNAEKIIREDFKEKAEHNTIVDLLRNDLSINSNNVRVNKYRYIDKIETSRKSILQVSSEITGQLKDDYLQYLGDIIFGMLPAGSVSGAPKDATIKLINEAEGESRGYYTGVFGYFDGKELDSAVMIRFVEEVEGQLYYRSGGGITAYSNCESEYNEVLDKIYLPFI